tara:strand:- start:28 stop:183 length:156 start_codon:yes stop_codon:yes gene_type:complete
MALLTHHCDQFPLLVAQSASTTSQAMAVEFQLTEPKQNTEQVHPLIELAHR